MLNTCTVYYVLYPIYSTLLSFHILSNAMPCYTNTGPDETRRSTQEPHSTTNGPQKASSKIRQAAATHKKTLQATANMFATEKMQAKPAASSNNNTKARQHKQPEVGADSDDHKIRRATKRRTNSRRTTTSISCSSTKQNMWNCGSAC